MKMEKPRIPAVFAPKHIELPSPKVLFYGSQDFLVLAAPFMFILLTT